MSCTTYCKCHVLLTVNVMSYFCVCHVLLLCMSCTIYCICHVLLIVVHGDIEYVLWWMGIWSRYYMEWRYGVRVKVYVTLWYMVETETTTVSYINTWSRYELEYDGYVVLSLSLAILYSIYILIYLYTYIYIYIYLYTYIYIHIYIYTNTDNYRQIRKKNQTNTPSI